MKRMTMGGRHSAAGGGVWNAFQGYILMAPIVIHSISIIAFELIYPKCVLTLLKIERRLRRNRNRRPRPE